MRTSECVCYTSTHDSDTAKGWAEKLEGESLKYCLEYMGIKDKAEIPEGLLRLAWSSTAAIAIAQPQDLLGIGNEARINVPGTLGLNWRWRLGDGDCSDELAEKLARLSKVYNRCG